LNATWYNTTSYLAGVYDNVIWFAKNIDAVKYRQIYKIKEFGKEGAAEYTQIALVSGERRPLTIAEKRGESAIPEGSRVYRLSGSP
jgi:adenine-specific DNA-methyltransferase